MTFGLGKNGTLRSPIQSTDHSVSEVWSTPDYSLRRVPGHHHVPLVNYWTSTDDGIVSYSTIHCSVTADLYERPGSIETFTAHNSEWVSTFDYDRPPTLIAAPTTRGPEASEETGNAGHRAVLWLKEFFGVSQRDACSIAGVPEATFYVWQNNPSSSVRSSGARRALKLRASLEVAISRLGIDDVRRLVSAGAPSLEDRLREAHDIEWDNTVSEIARLGAVAASTALPQISDPVEYLQRVRDVDERATSSHTVGGAHLLDEDEISRANQEGW
ncbi:hypothetical protein [Nocardioides aquiterrae]|uniref:hypothetical protein n=1 Tax=Nocardioides aquiterrae TaxID=203799 RepID=UPI0031E4395F